MSEAAQQTLRVLKRSFWMLTQGGCCYLRISPKCQSVHGAMSFERRAARLATWEHLKPEAEGGVDRDNQLLACSECNGLKANFAIATPADFELARAVCQAWYTLSNTMGARLHGAQKGVAQTPLVFPVIDASSICCPVNAAARRALMVKAGFDMIENAAWFKGADGVKVYSQATSKPKQPPARAATVADGMRATPSQPRGGKHPHLPAAGHDKPMSVRVKEQRAAELGVTDPAYLPGAKRAERRRSAASEIVSSRIDGLLSRIFRNKGNGPKGMGL